MFAGLIAGSTAAVAQNVSCTCRYKGQDYGLGESICLKGSDGLRMATCAMVLNNTSWELSNAPCPLTMRNRSIAPYGASPFPPEGTLPAPGTAPARPS